MAAENASVYLRITHNEALSGFSRLHERVNDLPDANYATLKYLMGHLDK